MLNDGILPCSAGPRKLHQHGLRRLHLQNIIVHGRAWHMCSDKLACLFPFAQPTANARSGREEMPRNHFAWVHHAESLGKSCSSYVEFRGSDGASHDLLSDYRPDRARIGQSRPRQSHGRCPACKRWGRRLASCPLRPSVWPRPSLMGTSRSSMADLHEAWECKLWATRYAFGRTIGDRSVGLSLSAESDAVATTTAACPASIRSFTMQLHKRARLLHTEGDLQCDWRPTTGTGMARIRLLWPRPVRAGSLHYRELRLPSDRPSLRPGYRWSCWFAPLLASLRQLVSATPPSS